MNALASQSKPCLSTGTRAPVKNTVVCKAQPRHQIVSDVFEGVKKAAVIATAAGVLSLVPSSQESAFASATRNTSYEEQLKSSIKSRTGKDGVLPSLTSSPVVEPVKVEKKKKEETVVPAKKAVSETPRPSIGGKTAPADAPTLKGFDAPKPAPSVPAAAPVAAPVASKAPTEDSGDNKNAIVLGGVVLVAVAGVAVAGGNNSGEEGGTSASAAPSASAASGVDPNVAEARAWIAAWKKKHGKA